MKRLIPPKTKTSTTVFGNFTIKDVLVSLVILTLIFIIAKTTFPSFIKILFIIIISVIGITSITTLGDKKGYDYLKYIYSFIGRKKKIDSSDFKISTEVEFLENGIFKANNLYYKAVKITGIDFSIITEYKQDQIINKLANLYKIIPNGKIIKLDKPIDFNNYIDNVLDAGIRWSDLAETIPEEKMKGIETRLNVLADADDKLSYFNDNSIKSAEAFYLILHASNIDELNSSEIAVHQSFNMVDIETLDVDTIEMKQLFELFYDRQFNEDDTFTLPKIKEHWNKLVIDEKEYRIITLGNLPLFCANAWCWELFAIPGTKVSMNFEISADRKKIFKSIDKSIIELQARYEEKNATESVKQTIDTQLQSLQYLLDQLKTDNEQLHLVNLYIMTPLENVKLVEDVMKENNIYVDDLYYRQLDAYQAMMPNKLQNKKMYDIAKNLQSTTLSAMFPFVSKLFLDPYGSFMGHNKSNGTPVFFDLFDSWKQLHPKRSNANMAILGTSGKGKSFFSKKLLLQQACNGVKIFVLDPEDEYRHLSNQLDGNWIDIGGTSSGIINPLHIFASLQTDEDEDSSMKRKEVSSHRQFLMEFFSITMPNLDNECRAFLNQAIAGVYQKKGITDETDLSNLKASDYPIMQDIYEYVCKEFEASTLDFDRNCLRKLKNELEDFANGGVHSELWNGPTTLTLNNSFTTFNFQSLLANSNKVIADGQMILVMRFLMQEVIKNKTMNEINGSDDNILILVDEAHQFINERFPVALNFMAQMAKRIRKYGGSLIVATQSIKDYIGNENSSPLATAVINCCQYMTVFGLNPKDLDDLNKLYAKSGGLTEPEKEALANAETGEVLMFVDPTTRINMYIDLLGNELQYIENIKE